LGKQRLLDTRCSVTPATDVGASRCWRAVVRRWGDSIRRGCMPSVIADDGRTVVAPEYRGAFRAEANLGGLMASISLARFREEFARAGKLLHLMHQEADEAARIAIAVALRAWNSTASRVVQGVVEEQ
jgi:hypothetical protein